MNAPPLHAGPALPRQLPPLLTQGEADRLDASLDLPAAERAEAEEQHAIQVAKQGRLPRIPEAPR